RPGKVRSGPRPGELFRRHSPKVAVLFIPRARRQPTQIPFVSTIQTLPHPGAGSRLAPRVPEKARLPLLTPPDQESASHSWRRRSGGGDETRLPNTRAGKISYTCNGSFPTRVEGMRSRRATDAASRLVMPSVRNREHVSWPYRF